MTCWVLLPNGNPTEICSPDAVGVSEVEKLVVLTAAVDPRVMKGSTPLSRKHTRKAFQHNS